MAEYKHIKETAPNLQQEFKEFRERAAANRKDVETPTSFMTDAPISDKQVSNILHRDMSLAPEFVGAELSQMGYGQHDEDKITNMDYVRRRQEQGLDPLSQMRFNNQTGWELAANAAGSFGVLTATTAIDGILGMAVGIGAALTETTKGLINGNLKGENVLAAYDQNPFSESMTKIQNWAYEAMPLFQNDTYRANEASGQWWKNVITSSFGAEMFKNLGFTAGMILSSMTIGGMVGSAFKLAKAKNIIGGAVAEQAKILAEGAKVTAKHLKQAENLIVNGKAAVNLTADMAKAAKTIKNAGAMTTGINTVLSPGAEARFEGINARDEYIQKASQTLQNPEHQAKVREEALQEAQGDPDLAEEIYNRKMDEAIQSIEEHANIVTAGVNAYNYPVLMVSNVALFGKALSGGYRANRTAWRTLGDMGKGLLGIGEKSGVEGISRIALEGGKDIANATKSVVKGSKWARTKAIFKPILTEGEEEMNQKVISGTYTKWAEQDTFFGLGNKQKADISFTDSVKMLAKEFWEQHTDIKNYQDFAMGAITGVIGSPGRGGWQGGWYGGLRDVSRENATLKELSDNLNKWLGSDQAKAYSEGFQRRKEFEKRKEAATEAGDELNFKLADDGQLLSDMLMFEKLGRGDEFREYFANLMNSFDESQMDDTTKVQKKNELEQLLTKNGTLLVQSDDLLGDYYKYLKDSYEKIEKYTKTMNNLKTVLGENFTPAHIEELTWMFAQVDTLNGEYSANETKIKNYIESILNEPGAVKDATLKKADGSTITAKEILQSGNIETALSELANEKEVQEFFAAIESTNKKDLVDLLQRNKDIEGMRSDAVTKYNQYAKNPTILTERFIRKLAEEQEAIEAEQVKTFTDRLTAATNYTEAAAIFQEMITAANQSGDNSILVKFLNDNRSNPYVQAFHKYQLNSESMLNNVDSISDDDEFKKVAENVIKARVAAADGTNDITHALTAAELATVDPKFVDQLNALFQAEREAMAAAAQTASSVGSAPATEDEDRKKMLNLMQAALNRARAEMMAEIDPADADYYKTIADLAQQVFNKRVAKGVDEPLKPLTDAIKQQFYNNGWVKKQSDPEHVTASIDMLLKDATNFFIESAWEADGDSEGAEGAESEEESGSSASSEFTEGSESAEGAAASENPSETSAVNAETEAALNTSERVRTTDDDTSIPKAIAKYAESLAKKSFISYEVMTRASATSIPESVSYGNNVVYMNGVLVTIIKINERPVLFGRLGDRWEPVLVDERGGMHKVRSLAGDNFIQHPVFVAISNALNKHVKATEHTQTATSSKKLYDTVHSINGWNIESDSIIKEQSLIEYVEKYMEILAQKEFPAEATSSTEEPSREEATTEESTPAENTAEPVAEPASEAIPNASQFDITDVSETNVTVDGIQYKIHYTKEGAVSYLTTVEGKKKTTKRRALLKEVEDKLKEFRDNRDNTDNVDNSESNIPAPVTPTTPIIPDASTNDATPDNTTSDEDWVTPATPPTRIENNQRGGREEAPEKTNMTLPGTNILGSATDNSRNTWFKAWIASKIDFGYRNTVLVEQVREMEERNADRKEGEEPERIPVYFRVDPSMPTDGEYLVVFMAVKDKDGNFHNVDTLPKKNTGTLRKDVTAAFIEWSKNNSGVYLHPVTSAIQTIKSGDVVFEPKNEEAPEANQKTILSIFGNKIKNLIFGVKLKTSMRSGIAQSDWIPFATKTGSTEYRNGMLFVGVEDTEGKQIPVAVTVARYQAATNDPVKNESAFVKKANKKVDEFVKALRSVASSKFANKKEWVKKSDEVMSLGSDVMKGLSEYFYFGGESNYHINLVSKEVRDERGYPVLQAMIEVKVKSQVFDKKTNSYINTYKTYTANLWDKQGNLLNEEQIASELKQAFYDSNMIFNVDRLKFGNYEKNVAPDREYINDLVQSGLLTTNLVPNPYAGDSGSLLYDVNIAIFPVENGEMIDTGSNKKYVNPNPSLRPVNQPRITPTSTGQNAMGQDESPEGNEIVAPISLLERKLGEIEYNRQKAIAFVSESKANAVKYEKARFPDPEITETPLEYYPEDDVVYAGALKDLIKKINEGYDALVEKAKKGEPSGTKLVAPELKIDSQGNVNDQNGNTVANVGKTVIETNAKEREKQKKKTEKQKQKKKTVEPEVKIIETVLPNGDVVWEDGDVKSDADVKPEDDIWGTNENDEKVIQAWLIQNGFASESTSESTDSNVDPNQAEREALAAKLRAEKEAREKAAGPKKPFVSSKPVKKKKAGSPVKPAPKKPENLTESGLQDLNNQLGESADNQENSCKI